VGGSTRQFGDFVARWQEDRLLYYRKHHGRSGGWWLKACVTFTLVDWVCSRLGARLRGLPSEPVGPMLRKYLRFLLL
jgi:hypothetical protein